MESNTYLTFVLEQEVFAVNVKYVLEVLEQQPITSIPQAPPHILGIINFRGEILPVIDTKVKLNIKPEKLTDKNYLIVYNLTDKDQNFSVAATADAVNDVIEITENEIKPIPEQGMSYDNRLVAGVLRRFIMVLNISNLFSASDKEIKTEEH